jgi:hypothetical protein
MMRLVHLLQSIFDHMRIDLRGRYVGVAQHHLDGAKIGPSV